MPKISLEAVRVNAGMSQKEWAKKLGVSNNTVINWEKHRADIVAGKRNEPAFWNPDGFYFCARQIQLNWILKNGGIK